jgi:hypothetical protein
MSLDRRAVDISRTTFWNRQIFSFGLVAVARSASRGCKTATSFVIGVEKRYLSTMTGQAGPTMSGAAAIVRLLRLLQYRKLHHSAQDGGRGSWKLLWTRLRNVCWVQESAGS